MLKNFKLPHTFAILFVIMAFAAILTNILPAGSFAIRTDDGTVVPPMLAVEEGTEGTPVPNSYEVLPSRPQGLFAVLEAPITGLKEAIGISIFILMVGGLIGVVNKTGAIDIGIGSLMMKMRGREKLLITILTFLFSLGGTVYGMCEETIAFYPLLLPIMIKAGYDSMVVMGVIMGGSAVGVLASTVNPFAIGVASGFAGISLGNGIGTRLILWFVLTSIIAVYLSRYAKKVFDNPEKSLLHGLNIEFPFMKDSSSFESHANEKLSVRQSIVLVIFSLSFVFMTYSVIPFVDLGIDFLPTLGWWFSELSALFMVMGVICGIVAGLPHRDTIDSFLAGMGDVLSTAIVVGFARGIVVIMNDGLITSTILNWSVSIVEPLGSVLFVNVLFFLNMVLTLFITSTSGLATLTMPIFAPLADLVGISKELIINAFVWGSGVTNIVAPTSGIVMGASLLCKVPYEKWFKFMLPILGICILVSIIFLTLSVVTGVSI